MLINRAVPNLFQGISQQPPSVKLSTQADVQINGYSSIVEGLKKRPPTNYVAKLRNTTATDAYIHTINTASDQQYVVVLLDDDLEVYTIGGTACTVSFPNGKAYLNATTPRTAFSALTVNDYTFIVNNTITVTSDSAASGWNEAVCYFYVSYAAQSVEFKAMVDGTTGSYTSGATTSTTTIATNLATALGTALGGGYTVTTPYDGIIKVVKGSGTISSAGASDGYGNQSLRLIFKQVQEFSYLPPRFDESYVVKIQGTANDSAYYVKYDDANGTGVWQETVQPGISVSLTDSTMPWTLTRTGATAFTFDKAAWTDRTIGDDDSNPMPSFVGREITDVFFHRNRLGFTADENVILSASGDFFNFFNGSATALLDSDPIDIAISSTTASAIKHVAVFNSTLLLFTDNGQFQLVTPNNVALTPKSVTVNPTTRYPSDNLAKPVTIGQDVYFSVPRGSYTGLMEYFVQPLTSTNEASDVTAHVPNYIPSGVFKIIGSSIYDILFCLNTTSRYQIHTYKFYWGADDKKEQSSWSVWNLDSSDVILGGDILANKLFLAVQRSDGVYLEYIDLQANATDTGMGVLVHLDRKKSITGSYSAGTGLTTWTIPYAYSGTVSVVLGSSFGVDKGKTLSVSRPTTTTITATGDYSSGAAYVGLPYTMTYTFSPFYFKDESKVTIEHYKLKMKYINVVYDNSAYFKVEVTPDQRDTYTYELTGQILGTTAVLGDIPTDSGSLRVPLMCGSDNLTVSIKNDSWLPCYLQSAEWGAKVSYTFKRI